MTKNGKPREYVLPNGLVVALQNTPTQTVAAELRVNYGPIHEQGGEEGRAHFLEHCLANRGSEKYDPETAGEMESLLGYSNAMTSLGRTSFLGNMLSSDLEMWLDLTSDHVFKPRLDAQVVNQERERVLREIADIKSKLGYSQGEEFKAALYKGHPKGRFIAGKESIVQGTDSQKLRDFHARGYHPNNMDLILVGAIPENAEKLIEQYFASRTQGENTRITFPEAEPLINKTVFHRSAPEALNRDHPEESSAQIYLAFRGPADVHPDNTSVRSMASIMGGGFNSLLFQNLSVKRGLAYHVGASSDGKYNLGEIDIEASVPAPRIEESVSLIFDQMEQMKKERVSQNFIDRIRRGIQYGIANALDSNGGHIQSIETKLDLGLTSEDLIARYNAVTPDSILEAANKYLPSRDGNYVLHIRNPMHVESE